MSLDKKIEQLASLPTPPNEESAKNQLIQPVLRLLGWPSDDPEHVAFEHHAGGGHVDIALRVKNHFVAFLEAKAPGKSLDAAVSQVLGYAFHGGVDICVLTTGIEWWFYLPMEKGPPQKRRFAVLDIGKDPPSVVAEALRRYVSRSALASGSAERHAKEALMELRRVERLRVEIPRVWKRMRSDPDPQLMSLIQQRVLSVTGLTAAAWLVAEVLGMTVPPPGPGPVDGKPSKPAAWRLWGTETAVSTWANVLVGVFEAVHRRHEDGFLESLRPVWGKRQPWVSADPKVWKQRSSAMGDTGLYVYSNLSADAVEKRCRGLLKAFGHSPDELDIQLK